MPRSMKAIMKPVSLALVITTLSFGFASVTARAGLVPTGTVVASAQAAKDRAIVLAALDRREVRAELERMGVSPANARSRVNALSDADLHRLAGRVKHMPAGGDILDVALIVFLVLLLTDILGYTDVFPFVKKHAHPAQ